MEQMRWRVENWKDKMIKNNENHQKFREGKRNIFETWNNVYDTPRPVQLKRSMSGNGLIRVKKRIIKP
eukprot:UN09193